MDKTLKQVKRFYIDQFNQYSHHLAKIDKNINDGINKGHLHAMRLTIKNIKAIHEFLVMVDFNTKIIEKLNKKINKINKPLGRIRECQINRGLARKIVLNYSAQKAYLEFLKKKEKKSLSKLKRNISVEAEISQALLLNQFNKKWHHFDEDGISTKFKDFLLQKVEAIFQLQNGLNSEQQIHQIRKNLKLIKTNLSIVKMDGIIESKKLQKELIGVEQRIGNWHDFIVFRDSMVEFISENKEFESVMSINIDLIESDNLMFRHQLPELMNPLITQLHKELEEKKEPV